MRDEDENIFFEEFLVIEKGLYVEVVHYLKNKFTSFSNLINQAKKIQEIKLYKFGAFDKLNAQITKFVLVNEHGKTSERTENTNTQELLKIEILQDDKNTLDNILNEND